MYALLFFLFLYKYLPIPPCAPLYTMLTGLSVFFASQRDQGPHQPPEGAPANDGQAHGLLSAVLTAHCNSLQAHGRQRLALKDGRRAAPRLPAWRAARVEWFRSFRSNFRARCESFWFTGLDGTVLGGDVTANPASWRQPGVAMQTLALTDRKGGNPASQCSPFKQEINKQEINKVIFFQPVFLTASLDCYYR